MFGFSVIYGYADTIVNAGKFKSVKVVFRFRTGRQINNHLIQPRALYRPRSSIDCLNWTDVQTTWIYFQDPHAVKLQGVRTIW